MPKTRFIHVPHDFGTGWPSGEELFYECLKCGVIIPSTQDGQCECGGVYVDAGYGRAGADDISQVRLLKRIPVR
jgi:hypothetical protein